MITKSIDEAVSHGIRKTIANFQKNPFYYFTEHDIHVSLVRDILDGNSDIFYLQLTNTNVQVSMVHLEYPTNFKYSRAEALNEGKSRINKANERRGNFDLAVLNGHNFRDIVKKNKTTLIDFLKCIISKDVAKNVNMYSVLDHPVGELIDYAIEVKFFHFNNASQEMFEQVKIDNYKLMRSIKEATHIKPVNLVFCYYWSDGKKNQRWENRIECFRKNILAGRIGIDSKKLSEIPEKVINILIEVKINQKAKIEDTKISYYYNGGNEKTPLWVCLLTNESKICKKNKIK